VIYQKRRAALTDTNLRPEIERMLREEFEAVLGAHTDVRTGETDEAKVLEVVGAILPLDQAIIDQMHKQHPNDWPQTLDEYAKRLYDQRETQFTPQGMRIAERLTYLRILDSLWIEHLEAMEGLREGIGLRAIGQREPLVEYKREGFKLFGQLLDLMEREIAGMIFKVTIQAHTHHDHDEHGLPVAPVETALTKAAAQAETITNPDEKPKAKPAKKAESKKVGRNDPCPCGSGLKYKKCGMIDSPEHQKRMAGRQQ
jgi:preprotein translocase subunit SecA